MHCVSSARGIRSALSAAGQPLFLASLCALGAAACVIVTRAASRATGPIIVNTTSDDKIAGNGLCSLREAIGNANASSDTTGGDCVAGTGSDTIAFSASGTITLSDGLPTILNTLTIDGTGQAITVDGASSFPIFTVDSVATFDLRDLTVANGKESVVNNGTMTIEDSSFTGNVSAVVIISSGTLTVTGCTFANTFAAISNSGKLTVATSTFFKTMGGIGGGAISSSNELSVSDSVFSGAVAANGGALFCSGGTVTVSSSTFSGNFAASDGGAIATSGSSTCTLTVTNSTFAGNTAFGLGGAIFNGFPSTLSVTNSTLSGNDGSAGGGIDNQALSPAVTVVNSILANNAGGNCGSGAITDGGHNIDDGGSCAFSGTGCATTIGTSFCNTNPQLDPAGLASNGGPTQTIALQAGSPAINAGDAAVCAAPPVNNLDQRGLTRPGIGAVNCSIGAYEFGAAASQLLGSVTLQGRPTAPDPRWSVPLRVSLAPQGGGDPVTCTPTTDTSGNFACGFAPGTYVGCVKHSHTLQNCQSVSLVAGSNPVNFGTLREGDASDDNCVTLVDFSILVSTFGKCAGDPGFDPRADFNGDGCVTLVDFSLLVTNFGSCGATPAAAPGRPGFPAR